MNGAPGYLLLEDGRRFDGLLFGSVPSGLPAGNATPGIGEVVFQTGMTGYQEVITDPSYRGQIVTFTASHIGNTGTNRYDSEAPKPALAGIVTRMLTDRPSSWRDEESLPAFLERHDLPCLSDVDTRALTRHLRDVGALRGVIVPASVDQEVALARVKAFPGLTGRDLVREVAPEENVADFLAAPTASVPNEPATIAKELADEFPYRAGVVGVSRITLIHCGMKEGIDACLRRRGAKVRIVTPNSTPEELLAGNPDGLFLSNGPGDPDALETLIKSIRQVIGKLPIMGICLGHEVLALALGAKTYKMKFGHHGINHPVRSLQTGAVLVTSQNHGFAVDRDTLLARVGGDKVAEATPTHESLNDGVLEGFAVPELAIRAVQFHPEAQGGPHDARHLFNGFLESLKEGSSIQTTSRPGALDAQ
jgi:carbamoyl-phosphate synthase small subunit